MTVRMAARSSRRNNRPTVSATFPGDAVGAEATPIVGGLSRRADLTWSGRLATTRDRGVLPSSFTCEYARLCASRLRTLDAPR